MAELIPISELAQLKSASVVKAVSDEAVKLQAEQAVAYLINTAANCGQHSVIYKNELSKELEKTLKAQGYKITRYPNSDFLTKIEGF